MGLLALLGNAFYAILVHRLTIYAPRFLPTLGRPHAVALHFTHCDQLVAGLAPAGVRPCWAHPQKRATRRVFLCPLGGQTVATELPTALVNLDTSSTLGNKSPSFGPDAAAGFGA